MTRDPNPSLGTLPGSILRMSPNRDQRPPGTTISLLVIHNISLPPGNYAAGLVADLFLNRLDASAHAYFRQIAGLRVSAHLLIDRAGTTTQFVPFEQRAWHAGVSRFAGRDKCNDFSIGIELLGDDHTDFTEAQYRELTRVSRWLLREYPAINRDRIVGHADIAPGRKTDPGPHFDWRRYRASLPDS